MGIKSVMTGSPWHVEKMVRQEGDSRRHRSRCIHNDKKNSHCSKVVGKCIGAAHCSYYEECQTQGEEATKVVNDENKSDFKGIRMIKISDIELRGKYRVPAKDKISAVISYFKENGKLDKPISVSCNGNKYVLEDKYLRYYVAKQLGLKEVPAKISTEKENKLEDKIRIIGRKVTHSKFGVGKIVSVSDDKVEIAFNTGKTIDFSIDICVKKELLTIN